MRRRGVGLPLVSQHRHGQEEGRLHEILMRLEVLEPPVSHGLLPHAVDFQLHAQKDSRLKGVQHPGHDWSLFVYRDRQAGQREAFATPFGLYQQVRLGFGLKNRPPTYSRLVEKILRKVPKGAIRFHG